MIIFDLDCNTNCSGRPNFVGVLEFHKYTFDTDYYRLFCFLTDSVFYVLFAYFDASMASIKWYEPQRSYNTVDITQI